MNERQLDLLRRDRAIYETYWGLYWLQQAKCGRRFYRRLTRRLALHKTKVLATGRVFERRDLPVFMPKCLCQINAHLR